MKFPGPLRIAFGLSTLAFLSLALYAYRESIAHDFAGVSEADPETVDDLDFQDETGNGASDDVGHVWGARTYPLGTATAGGDGLLWVALGVWGTFETPRAYFIDDVEVTFTRR